MRSHCGIPIPSQQVEAWSPEQITTENFPTSLATNGSSSHSTSVPSIFTTFMWMTSAFCLSTPRSRLPTAIPPSLSASTTSSTTSKAGVQPFENVVKFYGSFRQLGSYCLILKYADGRDLGEFFDNCPAPSTPQDVVLFWKNLFQVFSGLDRIHQLMSYNEDEVIKGIHEDIRPENILLMKGASGSRYDFTPKIVDFGLYSRVRTARARASGSMGLDHDGNQRFSSPKCCHHTAQRHKGANMIATSADIFSMGAVLSHTAAWVSGYEGCFHDSIEPLPVVRQHHCTFKERCKKLRDDVTPAVLDWVEEFMLIRTPKDRLRARAILEKFEQLMDNWCKSMVPLSLPATTSLASPATDPPSCASDMTTMSPLFSEPDPSPSTLDGASPPPTAPPDARAQPVCRPSLQAFANPVGVSVTKSAGSAEPQQQDSTTTMCDDPPISKESQQLSPLQTQQPTTSLATSTNPPPVTTLGPTIRDIYNFHQAVLVRNVNPATADLVKYLEHNLGGRDQLFFIDGSSSMLPEKITISGGFRALAFYKAKKTKHLQKLVERCEYHGKGQMMEGRLAELIDNVIVPRLPYRRFGINLNIRARKKVSVYIFTDGDWGDERHHGDACRVERYVKRLIEELKHRRLDRTQVSLHFVRFGDKANGKKHLEHLDECGRDDMDIVDVKHMNGDVKRMIIGPLTRSNDDKASG
ncbi:kinase-like domain-containing protein [Podospora australis]|uniref:Kinase-like domain-containing protein n=1 Tax=Podospora australis TaxID=1536484 RepID=A0AAN6WPZ4_9PEZI|nr:kinase-like domain-containing protein [Podospora australis]